MPTNLYEYYTGKGQALPSVQERMPVAQEAGISDYRGTAEQNTALLSYLQGRDSGGSTASNLPKIEQPVDINRLGYQQDVNLPQPESYNIVDTFTQSLTSSYERARTQLEDEYASRIKELETQSNELREKERQYLEKLDPTKRETYSQEQRIIQNELDAAEEASRTVKEDFQRRRGLVDELESIMMENNAILKREANLPLSSRVLSQRASDVLRDNNARAGVIEATMAALDGNISMAHNIMNQAKNSVAADWNDKVNYYNTLLALNRDDMLKLDNESKEYAQRQLALIENDMTKLDSAIEYIRNLMIDPQTAQFIAEAGVKMTDTIEEINEKLATYALAKEREDIKNKLALSGYDYVVAPTSTAGLIPINVGGQTMYFKEPVDIKGSTSSGEKSSFTEKEKRELRSIGLTDEEINELDNSIKRFGLDVALKLFEERGLGEDNSKQVKEMYLKGIDDRVDMSDMDIADIETEIRDLLPDNELSYVAEKLGFEVGLMTTKKGRINKMFQSLTRNQMMDFLRAVSNGADRDEVVKLLGGKVE